MKKIAITDISSSSVSLLIAKVENGNIERIFRDRKNISVFDYLDKNSNLEERGKLRIIETLSSFISHCKNLEVECIYSISTLRPDHIHNLQDLISTIKKELGLSCHILDGKDEAYADYTANERYSVLPKALLIDIGGATTELCDLNNKNKDSMTSLSMGSISLYKDFCKKLSPNDKESDEMKKYIKEVISKENEKKPIEYNNAVLLGSCVQALYDVYADYYDIIPENGERIIQYKKLKKLIKHLIKNQDKCDLIIKNAPEKIHLIIPTAQIAKEIIKKFEITNVIISDLGVKEGYLKLIQSGEEKLEGLCL